MSEIIEKKEVPGSGNKKSKIVFIGEAPGAEEVKTGLPFQGMAGKKLDELLKSINLKRDDVYITNVVKVRPTKQSKKGNDVNCPPNSKLKEYYMKILEKELMEMKNIQLIVTLGNNALQCFSHKAKISNMSGKDFQHLKWNILPLYHPSPLNKKNYKRLEEDFKKIQNLLSKSHNSEGV